MTQNDEGNCFPGPRDLPAQTSASCKKLSDLQLDDLGLRSLPVDTEQRNTVRDRVEGACWSRVNPTPVKNPRLVAASLPALQLIELCEDEVDRPEFAEYISGNALLPGSQPAAHCYAGHQFGYFSGQLGDGAAIMLGEVVNSSGQRWELQLKGAGLTPYSRSADGRKVLRSSVREFLCSEAMYFLGIPTTRAGAVVVSDTRVMRDMFYSGNPIMEQASVVLRLAPTFFRFGSFEIFKPVDSTTGRQGPSAGKAQEMLPGMIDYVIKNFFPSIWQKHLGSATEGLPPKEKQEMYLDWYREVLRRTAQLVAAWQSVGFIHGVLNTDNMSIIGLTLDYGPFGFMDRYNPDRVPNTSDDSGRYDYKSQPERCRWNCEKLGEAIREALPISQSKKELFIYDEEYERCYWSIFRRKLGLARKDLGEADQTLINDLLQVMHDTGADFTNTFRQLATVPTPHPGSDTAKSDPSPAPAQDSAEALEDGGFLERLLPQLASPQQMAEDAGPRVPRSNLQMMLMLASREPGVLQALGMTPQLLRAELAKAQQQDKLRAMSREAKAAADRPAWQAWLRRYTARLQQEAAAGATHAERVKLMNSVNPKYVLRNWIAQQAIEKAEKGDFSEVRRVLQLLQHPYDDDAADKLDYRSDADGSGAACARPLAYDGPVPEWAADLCVSCSS